MKKTLFTLILGALVFGFAGCKENTDPTAEFSETSITLYADDTRKISDGNHPGIKSDNEFVATASTDGTVTAKHVGSATISSGNSKCQVRVRPRYNLYPDPYMVWGATKAQVKAAKGTPMDEETDTLTYEVSTSPSIVMIYSFENGGLSSATAGMRIVDMPSYLVDFLSERYAVVSTDPIGLVHLDEDGEIDLVLVMVFSGQVAVIRYSPYDGNTRSSQELSFEKMEKMFGSLD